MLGNRSVGALRAKISACSFLYWEQLSLCRRIVNVGIMNPATGYDADVHESPKAEGASDCVDRHSALDAGGQEEPGTKINRSLVPLHALESDLKPFDNASGPTGIADGERASAGSAKPKAKLRSCANPLYPLLLEIARAKNKDLELLFTILWSINAPPSLRALPRIARHLRRSLLILQLKYEVNLASAGLGEWPEMLKWLASDPEVNHLCYGKKRQFTSVHYHCATTHSFYAFLWELVGRGLACVRAYLALLYIDQAAKRVCRENYESHLREGSEVALRGHNPYEASHAAHILLKSENARLLLSRVADTSSFDELYEEVNAIDAKQNETAILLHLPALKGYLTRLRNDVPTDRITSITSRQRPSSSTRPRAPRGTQNQSKTDVHTVETAHGKVGIRRRTPPVDERTRSRLRETDGTPDEVSRGEAVWIATSPEANVDPAVHAAIFRQAARAMHKPTELMLGHQRHLSTDELTLLLRQSREAALRFAGSSGNASEPQRKLAMLATALCSLFTWTDIDDAAETLVFGQGTPNTHSRHAIFVAEDPADDYFRIEALVPEYTTVGKFDVSLFRNMADYVILPLPPIVGLVIRALFRAELSGGVDAPLGLMRNTAGLERSIERILKEIEPTGRLTLSRIRESLFSRVVSATRGDVALSSLILARKHYSVDAELYYLAYGTREIAKVYLEAVQKIHTAAFTSSEWTPPAVDIDRLVPDADLGCRYYPLAAELGDSIAEIRERAVDAWRKMRKRRNFDALDQAFVKLHNDLTLYICLRFAYSTGVRAITSPLPNFDEIIVLELADGHCVGVLDWSDKDDQAHYHKRELFLDQDELEDLKNYAGYLKNVRKAIPGPKSTKSASCFYIVSGKRKLVTPTSTAKLFGDAYPYPPNTHRRVLSRSLRLAGMSPEIIRAGILGHWSTDREPWSSLSGLSLPMIRDAILRYVPPLVKQLGFTESLEKVVLHG